MSIPALILRYGYGKNRAGQDLLHVYAIMQ